MFREPIARANSMYNFFVRENHNLRWIDERAYAQRTAGSAVLMLAGQRYGLECLMQRAPCSPVQPNTMLALKRLDTEFAYVGLTDEWALSICLFHAKFGGACLAHEFLNTHPTNSTHPTKSTALGRPLGDFVDRDDNMLFSRAAERFWNDVHEYNVTSEHCARTICPAAASHFI